MKNVNAGNGIGETLKRIRRKEGLSVPDVARRVNISPTTIMRVEKGQQNPFWGNVIAYLDACGYGVEIVKKPQAAEGGKEL